MPDEPHKRRKARENKAAMSTAPPASTERALAGPEWRKQLAQRPRADLGVDALALTCGGTRASRHGDRVTRTWSHRTFVWGKRALRRGPRCYQRRRASDKIGR